MNNKLVELSDEELKEVTGGTSGSPVIPINPDGSYILPIVCPDCSAEFYDSHSFREHWNENHYQIVCCSLTCKPLGLSQPDNQK